MEDEFVNAQVVNAQEQIQVVSATVNSEEETEFRLPSDVVRALPIDAVKDLFSFGLCIRCIFRLFGIYKCLSPCASLSTSMICSIVEKMIGLEGILLDNGLNAQSNSSIQLLSKHVGTEWSICRLCMGILQLAYVDDNEVLVKRESANTFAQAIADIVKQGCHQIDSFSLEVSVPPFIVENEEASWLCMKEMFGSRVWFQEMHISEHISLKDALKLSITSPLETLLGVRSGSSPFRICLSYSSPDSLTSTQNTMVNNQWNKKKRSGTHHNTGNGNGSGVPQSKSSNIFQDLENSNRLKFDPEKIKSPLQLTCLCCRTPIYIGGRYLKHSTREM